MKAGGWYTPPLFNTSMFSAADHGFMAQALRLAEHGLDTTSPNPRVGCVIVREGRVVGQGWHVRAGEPHAEIHALAEAGEQARGATAYVTLEPCCHTGRTPPCTDALIRAGVVRVVAAMVDPNPKVAGNGLEQLRQAGITVESGLMQPQAQELNIGFISRMQRGRPWVRLKVASSLDGGTALSNGVSQWITGAAARTDSQHWRARACAILTGAGTVLHDNPRLNVRLPDATRQPLRVVVDSHLRTPPEAEILKGGALLVCADDATRRLYPQTTEILKLDNGQGQVNLAALLAELARRGINELHVEAGATLNGALLAQGLVDELLLYLAPKLLGGTARGLFDIPALTLMEQSITLDIKDVTHLGQDLRIRARILPAHAG